MLGEKYRSNPPTLNPNAGAGHVQKLAGLDAYVSGSTASNLAVILVSDIMGYEAPILRDVYVFVLIFSRHAKCDVFRWKEKGAEDAKRIIEALKGKGASSVGAAGFSWGGKVAVDLAKPGLTKAVVLLYPSGVTVDDIKGVQVPIAILCAEVDTLCPPEHVKQYEQALAAKPEVGSFVKLFPGVAHGWAVRYNEDDPEAVKAAEEAHQDMLTGLISYESPLLRKLADKVATAGYYVVVPDFFYGDPYNPENADRPVLVWLKDHGPDKGFEDAKRVIEALKGKGVSSVGAAGFCWGDVDTPISILGAEIDKVSPPELVRQFEPILAAKSGVDGHVKYFLKLYMVGL
ncbi:endo-1,3-1,4-beta-D-glucanase-like [Senna tora]|uniref:Endo-1,3-1,4-beta-D-glucanase-like n=1 Tax=Senna tora TaxID=362788 RepID=A0A834W9V7_9FABA|nr:endo-1,3-1,4-beta-D-glucanase-like [Senna tora]